MTNLKLVYITKVLLIKLNKIESDFKVVHHLSTNHAFSEIHADPLKLSIDYTQNYMKRFKGMIFILYSGTSLAYFGTSSVYCLYYVCGDLNYCFIKYHTVHIVLHKCNMPVPELRHTSIL